MLFFGKKKQERRTFDREKLQPAIRSSICTGEKTAGFVSRETGKFIDEMLIRSEEDLREFLDTFGIREDEIRHIY